MDPNNKITYFGETDSRNKRVKFGIKAKDRTRHMYVIGKTGMGKSTLLENMAIQDIQNGEGMAFIDPHGKTAELLLDYVPPERIKDVIYFAPFDLDHPISFNVMEDVGFDKRHLVASGLMSTFKKIWQDAWSARMEYILSNTLLALLEYPSATLLGVNRMLSDKDYRKKVVDNISDPAVKSFWVDEFAKYTEKFAADATPAIQNKIGQFTANPLIRNIIGQPKSSFDIRRVMDEKKILIINLSKGRVGETNATLLGSMLVTKIYLGAMSRADVQESALNKLPNFYLYVDEFQSFANESFANILSEARKYKLNLTITHQYVEQMPEEVRAAVFGNVGTMISFRVGAFDAELFEKEFAPQFTAEDLVNLGIYQLYLKLMIDGVSSSPFSASSLPPYPQPVISYKREIIDSSRKLFAQERMKVEEAIKVWHETKSVEPKPQNKINPNEKTDLKTKTQAPIQTPVQNVTNGNFKSGNNQNIAQNNNIVQKPVINQNSPQNAVSEPKIAPKTVQNTPRVESTVQAPKPTLPPIEELDEKSDDFLPLKELSRQLTQKEKEEEQKKNQLNKVLDKKKNGAGVSDKNTSDLRSALASVLPKKTPPVSVNVENKISEKKQEENKIEQKKENNISDHKIEHTVETKTEVKIETKKETNVETNPVELDNKPKEIPEDVLRKMLGQKDNE
jgi:hypothetical protein